MLKIFRIKKENKKYSKEIEDKYKKFISDKEDIEKRFEDYVEVYDVSENDGFMFMYRNCKDMKDTLIIASYLNQINIPLKEIKKSYSINDEYIDNLVNNLIPQLKINAYKYLDEIIPNAPKPFGWDNTKYLNSVYKELIDRIDYFFEIRRNQNKIKKSIKNEKLLQNIINNKELLVFLNYYSVKDALIVSSNLNLLDFDDEEVQKIYPYDQNYLKSLFEGQSIILIQELLKERIEILKNIDIGLSCFNYEELLEEYEDILNRINDTKEYLFGFKKK